MTNNRPLQKQALAGPWAVPRLGGVNKILLAFTVSLSACAVDADDETVGEGEGPNTDLTCLEVAECMRDECYTREFIEADRECEGEEECNANLQANNDCVEQCGRGGLAAEDLMPASDIATQCPRKDNPDLWTEEQIADAEPKCEAAEMACG